MEKLKNTESIGNRLILKKLINEDTRSVLNQLTSASEQINFVISAFPELDEYSCQILKDILIETENRNMVFYVEKRLREKQQKIKDLIADGLKENNDNGKIHMLILEYVCILP